MVPKLISLLLCLVGSVISSPNPKQYGSYEDGYGHGGGHGGHGGYNVIGTVNKVVDYYSKPQYAFGYEVEDYYNALSHGRWEIRDGDVTQGQYRVLLPDGRIQIVSYIADKGGYRPTIQYIGKGQHPPPPPVYANLKIPKQLSYPHHEQPEIIKEVPLPPLPPPPPPQQIPHIEPAIVSGPFKLDVNPLGLRPYHGPGPNYYRARPFRDHVAYGSEVQPVKVSPSNSKSQAQLSRRRALLYNRTLFRRDIPKPPTTPRK